MSLEAQIPRLEQLSLAEHAGPSTDATTQVAGLDGVLTALRELIGWPLLYAKEGAELGVSWPRGLLLHGPPGCGKTLATRSIAAEFGARMHLVSVGNVMGAYMGESERQLREAFAAAEADACEGHPTIVFLDEIDALCPRRDAGRPHEARVVAQLLTLLSGTCSSAGTKSNLSIVAATNRPNAIDPALRRPGRLDREVVVPLPGPLDRLDILRMHTRSLPLAHDVDLPAVACRCHGYSGADLSALAREAAMAALRSAAAGLLEGDGTDIMQNAAMDLERLVTMHDFTDAMQRVRPSIARGAEADAAPVSWDDIGGVDGVKQRLQQAIEWPLQHAAAFKRMGLSAPRGVLLYGPPGCSKTTLARAVASASKATLLPLSGAQLFSMYVGEGEALLRTTFKLARSAAPSIIFLDEVDSLAGHGSADAGSRPDGDTAGGASASIRLVSALLTEMDGLESATGVQVLAATNRPQAIDAALLRPGRLEVHLHVPPPDLAGRLHVLHIHTRHVPLAADVDLQVWASATELFTGAELANLCQEAAMAALREDIKGAQHVQQKHFAHARAAARPALTVASCEAYARTPLARH